jgi:predicted nucleic acid-binding protein
MNKIIRELIKKYTFSFFEETVLEEIIEALQRARKQVDEEKKRKEIKKALDLFLSLPEKTKAQVIRLLLEIYLNYSLRN